MSASVRIVAALGAACLAVGIGTAVHSRPASDAVRLHGLSASEVTAVPAHPIRTATERVAILGDSVATASACSCRPFGPRLAELLARNRSQTVQVSTLARDGQTAAALVDQLTVDASAVAHVRAADAIVVVVGANDFDPEAAASGCTGTACFSGALAALPATVDRALARIRSLTRPRTRVLVLGYWNVFVDGDVASQRGATFQQTADALTRQVDDVLRRSASRVAATYVDLYGSFRADGTRNDTRLLADDGDHPNGVGHQRIARLLADYLEVAAG